MLAQQKLVGLVVAALEASPALAAAKVYRQRTRAVSTEVAMALVVRHVVSESTAVLSGINAPLDWESTLAIECIARSGANQTPDEAVGPLVLAVHACLTADTSLHQDGFEMQPKLRITHDQDELDERIGAAVILFTVQWRSPYTSLSA